jgi:hypothetical protein
MKATYRKGGLIYIIDYTSAAYKHICSIAIFFM